MTLSFPIGRVLGIPIRVHASWFIVLAIVTWTLSREIFEGSEWVRLSAALASALCVFASVLLHELGHCVFARFFGIQVRRIQLFLFGGVAEIVGEPKRVLDEIVIAAAGPAVSLLLAGGLAFAIALKGVTLGFADGADFGAALGADLLVRIAMVVCLANLALALFNLIPAFPTDGGRILRAVLWGVLGDYRRATSLAAGLGMMFAGGFILFGLASALGLTGALEPERAAGTRIGGLWWALIGIFLGRSASQANAHARVSAALRDGRIRDVTLPVRQPIAAARTLLDVLVGAGGPSASEMLLEGFPVAGDDGALVGFVEPARLHVLPREQWGTARVADVMTPLARLPRLSEDDGLDALLKIASDPSGGTGGALVYRGAALAGYTSRAELARYLFREE